MKEPFVIATSKKTLARIPKLRWVTLRRVRIPFVLIAGVYTEYGAQATFARLFFSNVFTR